MRRLGGSVVRATAPYPSPAKRSASGIWTIDEAARFRRDGVWTNVFAESCGATASASDANSYTFTAHNIGMANTNRVVVVFVGMADDGGGGPALNSATIGGNAATLTGVTVGGGSNRVTTCYLVVDSGTTADIVINLSLTTERAAIDVWALHGLTSTTIDDTGSATATMTDLTIQPYGVALIGATGTSAPTFVGVDTVDAGASAETIFIGGAARYNGATEITPAIKGGIMVGVAFH
jgi:hypothetical protein